MPTISHLLDCYTEVLDCAQAQSEAVRNEEWAVFEALAARRQGLMVESQTVLSLDFPDDPQPLIALLSLVAATDACAEEDLGAQRAELREEMGRFRQETIMAAAYRSPGAGAGPSLIDAYR